MLRLDQVAVSFGYRLNEKKNWEKGRNYVKPEYLDTTVKNMYFYLLDHFCQYQ
jgi:hypothetical protein